MQKPLKIQKYLGPNGLPTNQQEGVESVTATKKGRLLEVRLSIGQMDTLTVKYEMTESLTGEDMDNS